MTWLHLFAFALGWSTCAALLYVRAWREDRKTRELVRQIMEQEVWPRA
jgi:hypothetical protein